MTLMYEMAKQSSRDAATAVLVEQVSDAESRIVSSGRDFEYSSGIKYYSSNLLLMVNISLYRILMAAAGTYMTVFALWMAENCGFGE